MHRLQVCTLGAPYASWLGLQKDNAKALIAQDPYKMDNDQCILLQEFGGVSMWVRGKRTQFCLVRFWFPSGMEASICSMNILVEAIESV